MVWQPFGIRFTNVIWALGVGWGITTFFLGLVGGFRVGPPGFIWGLLAIVFGYLIVLPITIMAYWRPRAAGLGLFISFLFLESSVAASSGLRVAFLGGLIMAVPTGALIWGYVYIASVRTKSQGTRSSVGPCV